MQYITRNVGISQLNRTCEITKYIVVHTLLCAYHLMHENLQLRNCEPS